MREENEYYQAQRTKYVTNDGKRFDSKEDAKLHEDKLNGTKKTCDNCNGKGRVNERYEKVLECGYIPTSGEYVDRLKYDLCTKCGAKGYLEQKWV
jgi:hypothetical protein